MDSHNNVRLFLDRDKTGQNYSQQAIASSGKYSDESILYKGYNDLNEWVQQIGRSQKKNLHNPMK